MNDRILFRSDSLTEAASELNKLIDTLEDIAGDLNRLDTSAEWWSKVSVSTSHGKNNALITVSMLKSDFGKTREYVSSVSGGVRKAQELFSKADSEISKSAESMFSGSSYDLSANDVGDLESGEEAEEKKNWEDFIDLLIDILGKAGPFGAALKFALEPIVSWFSSGKFSDDDYSIGEAVFNVGKDGFSVIANMYKWLADDKKGIKDFFGLDKKTKIDEIFDDFTKDGMVSIFAYAKLALDVVSHGIDNYKEMKDGKIDAGRAVAETLVETGVEFVTDAGIEAAVTGVAIAVAGGAPAIVIGAGVVVVKEGLDVTCKWITSEYLGEEKGLVEGISDGLITIVTDPGQAWNNVKNSFSRIFSGKAAAAAGSGAW